MDSKAFAIGIGIVAVSSAGAFIIWVVLDAVVRLRQLRAAPTDVPLTSNIEVRLERIEAAVESIAIEVERIGEMQRFSTRLGQGNTPPEVARLARPITPH